MTRRTFRLRSTRLALAVGALTGLALVPSSLLGRWGVESAFVLGLVLPPFVAALGARLVSSVRRDRVAWPASRLISNAVAAGWLALGVSVVILGLNALQVRLCTPWRALAFVALGPGVGVAFAAIVGALAGASVRRPGLATTVAVLAPVASMAAGVFRFWNSPAVALYGHFAGWFPGTIYDEAVSLPSTLVSFRLVTAAWGLGLALCCAAAWDPESGLVRLRPPRLRLGAGVAGLALLAAAVAGETYGAELGYRTRTDHIIDALGTTQRGARCIVHAPRQTEDARLRRLVEDCDFHVARVERMLGVHQDAPVEAFFFQGAGQKRRLMGAGETFVAKPWRNEVYLQLSHWPHPVLEHELAHVVAGRVARGPWRIAGRLGGWIPDLALVEGLAVALAWRPRGQLTPHQWAKAMFELGKMPPLERVFGLSFLLQPPRHAYTVAGSFMRFVRERYGADALREAYRTADVAAAVGTSLETLASEWRAHLQRVPLPDDALARARLRFEPRSIFATVCPHRLAHLRRHLGADLAAGDEDRVRETCRQLLDISPSDPWGRVRLIGSLARAGRVQQARQQLQLLRGRFDAPRPAVAAAREAVADAAWRRGDRARAASRYEALLNAPRSPGSARALEVKALAARAGGRQAELVRAILVGDDPGATPSAVVVHLARELAHVREDGLGPYLEARQLHQHRRYRRALARMRIARRRGLPTTRLDREASRLVGVELVATRQWDEAARHWRERLGHLADPADRLAAREWLARIRYLESR